jgi:hypothetical protein
MLLRQLADNGFIGLRLPIFVCACALAISLAPAAHATPADTSRVLKFIGFEERRLGNREDLPMHWVKLDGPGLPHYVNGRLSNDRAHSGEYSFRFDLNGGSLIYRYDPNQILVQPNAHYRVECFVQTTPFPHARARLSVYLTDIDGNTIPNSTVHSELYAAKVPDEAWHPLTVELTAQDPAAAHLAVQLELLQPSFYSPSTLGPRSLFDQDINGSAWFDDVTISQVPQVLLSTQRPGNVFRRSDPLCLSVLVNDRFTDDLAAQLVIRDAGGASVYQRSGALDMTAAQDLGPGRKQMTLALPDLPPGWYAATLVMTSRGQFVGQQDLHLVRLADDAVSAKPDPRFGVIATDLPFEGWSQLPDILPFMSAGRVKLAVWSRAGDIQEVDPIAFDSLLERLQEAGITPTACLTALPPSLSQLVGGDGWTQLLKTSPNIWRPELAYLVARHANHLDRWQFGADSDAAEFLEKPQMRRVYDLLYNEFAGLMGKPDLAMPWPAWYDLSGKLPATVALSVPPDVLPAQLPLYIQDIRGHEGHNLSLSLQLLDDSYGREVQIRDLAQRVVYALAGGASRIDLPLPFTVRRQGDQVCDEPKEMLMIIRTLVTQLAGATFEGKIPNSNNVDAFLFDRDGEGIVVLWNRSNQAGSTPLALNLGAHPTRIDLWGNVSPVIQPANIPGGDAETVNLDVGPMPIFLVDIDGDTAQMRASVGLDKPLLESSFEPHPRRLHFSNSGHLTIGGTVKLTAPAGWTLTPSVFTFTLNPGETFDRELSIEFPYNSFAGPKTIQANFQVQAEKEIHFTVPISVSLGLSDVGMQTLALRDKSDLIVQQMISNYGDKPIDYSAFAVYPGQPRQERLVMQLGAGRTIIKLYRFSNVKLIQNAKVRSGLREMEGTRILNDEVEVQ